MKDKVMKMVKVFLWFIIIALLLFILDIVFIFIINRPIFAFKMNNSNGYYGLFFDVYNCEEYSVPQIKSKGDKFSCYYKKEYIIKNIVDDYPMYSCNQAIELFYSDSNYNYYWSCMKNNRMFVYYEDGSKENVNKALNLGHINISDLDRFNISYMKNEVNID